jgi:tetratricopeptide (TPR) repeat protein
MKRFTHITWCALAALIALAVVVPANVRAGSYGTELPFTAGTGARASAMGLAGSSLTGEPSVQFYNPACVAALQYKELEFYRTTFFDSKSAYHTIHFAYPTLDYGTLALSVLRLDVGDVEERDDNNILLSSDLKDAQTRILLGYAASLHSALAAGLNLKLDNHSFAGYSGSGIGLDLGFLATKTFAAGSRLEKLRAGLSLVNVIEPSVKLDQEDVADPLSLVFGGSAVYAAGKIGFITAVDFVAPRFSPFQVRFGQEISYQDMLAFRFGFDGSTPTFGAGAEWRNVAVNYAFRSEDLGSNHRISVSVGFGASVGERRESERAALEAELDRQINSKMSDLESSQLSETLKRADQMFTEARYGEAAAQYELALLWDSGNIHARSQIETCRYYGAMSEARSLMEEQNYLEALYQLRRALSFSPDDAEASALMTECNRRIREQSDHTDMVDHMLKRSIDLYAARRFAEAQAGFREILNLDPDNKLASEYEQKSHAQIQNQKQKLVMNANNLADRGEYAAAASALEQALRFGPDEQISVRISELQAKQRAEEQRQAQLRRETTKPPTLSVRSTAAPGRRNVDPAVLEPRYNEGLRYFEEGEFDDAVRRFQEVWAIAPDYHNVTELLTKAYLFMGMKKYSEENYDDAIVIWERALTVDPDNSKAKRYLQKAKEEASRLSSVNNGR